jgi:hypothetical protein
VQRGIEPLGSSPWQRKLKRTACPGKIEKQPNEGGGSVSLFQQAAVLSKNIVAMALDELEDGTLRHVSLTALPTGTEVTIVGEGFNRRTVRVRCNDRSYFVFVQDIEGPDSSHYLP